MRWKIILVNAGILVVVSLIAYALVAVSLREVAADDEARRRDAVRSLNAVNDYLALQAVRSEQWLKNQAASEQVQRLFKLPGEKGERATQVASRLRDAAMQHERLSEMSPNLVLFVDSAGVGIGRNGSALMRGTDFGAVYPSLLRVLDERMPASAVWANRERQEQMLVSYAPVQDAEGDVLGAVVLGTPLNDERLSRASVASSGHPVLLVRQAVSGVEILADSDGVTKALIEGVQARTVGDAVSASTRQTGRAFVADGIHTGHVLAAMSLEGYLGGGAVLISAVPASLLPDLSSVLWPIFGGCALGLVLVAAAGAMLGNYVSRPIADMEEGLLAVINGDQQLRFDTRHAELGGLASRLNSLLNTFMDVSEESVDDEGHTKLAPSGRDFSAALAVDEASSEDVVDPGVARALFAEPEAEYQSRLFREYISAKRELGDPVDHISAELFEDKIRQMAAEVGHPVRYLVQLRGGAVVLVAVAAQKTAEGLPR